MRLIFFYTFELCVIVLSIWYYFAKVLSPFVSRTMSLNKSEGSPSDDEIFFGNITLQEVKKRLFPDNRLKLRAASAENSPREYEDSDASLKILQTYSEPNLLSSKDSYDQNSPEPITAGCDMRDDDSFIKLENMVAKLCVSPGPTNNVKTEEFNNTLEVIEYILNNPPTDDIKAEVMTDTIDKNVNPAVKTDSEARNEICIKKLQEISPQKNIKVEKKCVKDSPEPPQNTPVKLEKKYKEIAAFMTPVNGKPKPVFKTPAQPLSHKKSATSLRKTPSIKSNAYQHISSPVASYIKNCPIVPLVKDVHPKKPLPGPSSIPKFKSQLAIKPSNKENINLPSVAYKSAKKTKVIDLPDAQKLPQSGWAQKIMTSLPRPVVMKHDHRELNLAKRKLLPQQEDSFADMSYSQAEVSVCTQKSAFKSNKNV